MKRLLPIALAMLAGCGDARREPVIEDAWVRLPAVPGRPGAAYFTLKGGVAPARLIGAESDAAARVELHEGGMAGGMMTMRPLGPVNVPPNAPVLFRPGGNHAMLFGIRPEVKPGGTMTLTLRFADGTTATTEARTVAAGDPAP